MALCWSLAHALATPQGIRERSLAPGLAESPGSVRADSSVVGSTQLWAPQAPESDDGYVAVQLREELPLLGPDWDDGATIGELQAWVSSALFDAAPLLSPSRTRVELRLLVPFEVSLARQGHEHASCSTEGANAAQLPLPFAQPAGASLLNSVEQSDDAPASLLDAATQAPEITPGDAWEHLASRAPKPGYAPTLAARVFDVVRDVACRGHTTIEDIRDQIRGALPRTSCEVEDGMPAFIGERMRWHPDRPSGSGSQQDSEQCESLRFSVSFLPDASLRADHEALIFNSAGSVLAALASGASACGPRLGREWALPGGGIHGPSSLRLNSRVYLHRRRAAHGVLRAASPRQLLPQAAQPHGAPPTAALTPGPYPNPNPNPSPSRITLAQAVSP